MAREWKRLWSLFVHSDLLSGKLGFLLVSFPLRDFMAPTIVIFLEETKREVGDTAHDEFEDDDHDAMQICLLEYCTNATFHVGVAR